MWIMSKASYFSLLIISFPRSAVTWSWFYILSDIFLCILNECPFFLSRLRANLVPNPVMKLISEMCLKIFHRENLCNPLINPLPASSLPASPMSLPGPTGGGALIPNWPAVRRNYIFLAAQYSLPWARQRLLKQTWKVSLSSDHSSITLWLDT